MEKSEREKIAEKRRLTAMKRLEDTKERFDKGIGISPKVVRMIIEHRYKEN